MRSSMLALVLLTIMSPSWAQTSDTCKIFIWDNDAGECAQEDPAVGMDSNYEAYTVWADRRNGKWDIYGQRRGFDGELVGKNFLVNDTSITSLRGSEKQPDISAISSYTNRFAAVWLDSLQEDGNRVIIGRLFHKSLEPVRTFQVSNVGPAPKLRPKVAMYSGSGWFVVVWAQYINGTRELDIYARLFNPEGQPQTDSIRVNTVTNGTQWRPCVAFNICGIMVAWEDRSGSIPKIYGQLFDPGLSQIGGNFLISDAESYATDPDIDAADGADFYAVAWHNRQPLTARDIYACRFSFSVGKVGQEFRVNPQGILNQSYNPSIAVFPTQDFVVAWHDTLTPETGTNTYVRYCYPYSAPLDTGNYFLANDKQARNQEFPDIASFSDHFTLVWHDSLRTTGRGDIFGQNGLLVNADPDSIVKFQLNYRIDNLRSHGRKVMYYPYKNFDNPSTPWNEDPIDEGEKFLTPLDSAFVRAFSNRNNIPGQQFVKITDSDVMAEDYPIQDQGKATTDGYDLCIMDLGYATPTLSAGTISQTQRCSLQKFSDDGGALLCSGGDFGQMYDSTTIYKNYFAAQYDDPGNPYPIGNIDSLGGKSGTFTQGMKFHYPFQEEPDNSIDFISPGSYNGTGAQIIFENDGPGQVKWIYCRGIAYAAYWKGQKAAQRSNIYIPFALGSLVCDGVYSNTQDELSRRILGYQGFNVEPAPIHDLTASSTSEGNVDISWTAPFDDLLTEAASAYRLKFTRYSSTSPDLGMLSSEEDFLDSGYVYNQGWAPGSPGATETKVLDGLPPGDTLILALKAGDASSPRRWGQLGAEPRVVVYGDLVTPHSIGIGYYTGCVRDFVATELIESRWEDTLFCTWDASNVYFGYDRCDLRTSGDLLIYFDVHDGGSDTTCDHNGSGAKSLFDVAGDFKPDYCLIYDDGTEYTIKRWNSASGLWQDTVDISSTGYQSLDSVNGYGYTELKVRFDCLGGYDTTRAFRYLVVAQNEADNNPFNVFPTDNGIAKEGKAPARYPYYYQVTNGLRSGLEPNQVSTVLAVELSEFSAMSLGGGVQLNWRTESETDNYQWLIERSAEPGAGYQQIASVPGQGNSPTGHCYSYADNAVLPGTTYYYLLGDQDFQENVTWHGPVSVTTGLAILDRVRLFPCLPNPSAGVTNVRYSLPRAATVELCVHDITGRLVRILSMGSKNAGLHSINWRNDGNSGEKVASGVYFYRLKVDGKVYDLQKSVIIR